MLHAYGAARGCHEPQRASLRCPRPRLAHRAGARVRAASGEGEQSVQLEDANWLQTSLNEAIASEDYARAARLRDALRRVVGAWAGPCDWFSLGVPAWLADRTERLGFPRPTEVQRRVLPPANAGRDVVLRSGTGSGKTLSFLLPVLSNLNLVQRSVPQALVVVPSRLLGVQHCLLAYRLVGGSLGPRAPGDRANLFTYMGPQGLKVRGLFDAADVQRAARHGWLEGCSVVVGTPEALGRAISCGALPLSCVDQLVVDEADACLPSLELANAEPLPLPEGCQRYVPTPQEEEEEGEAAPVAEGVDGDDAYEAAPPPPLQPGEAGWLWRAPRSAAQRWTTLLAGATLPESCLEAARSCSLIPDPVLVSLGQPAGLPATLTHRVLALPPAQPGGPPAERLALAALVRLIRADVSAEKEGAAPPRSLVFAPDVPAARLAADPLRSALWGQHTLAVLLPGGEEPTRAAHAFRDGAASLLLTTAAAERGMDMPSVRHVYSLGLPASASAYLHRAGRAGRLGATAGATVTTLCHREQLPALAAMLLPLGVALEEAADPGADQGLGQGQGQSVQALEDLFNLLS